VRVWLDRQGKFVPRSLRRIGDSKRGGKMGRKPRADRPLKRSDSSCREASRAGTCLTQADNTGSRRICPIAGTMKRNRERKQRLREQRCRGRNRDGPPHPATRTDAGAEIAGEIWRPSRAPYTATMHPLHHYLLQTARIAQLRECAMDCERKPRSIAVPNLATGFRRLDLVLSLREQNRRVGARAWGIRP
jgi:hypothetical protein